MREKIKFIALWLGRILSWACVIFIVLRLKRLWGGLEGFNLGGFELLILLAMGLFLSCVTYFYCFMWGQIVAFLGGKRLPFVELAHLFAKANLAKYLPGNVMHYVSRSMLAQKYGIPVKTTALASLLDIVMIVASAVLFILITVRGRLFDFLPFHLIAGSFILGCVVVVALFYAAHRKQDKIFFGMCFDRKLLGMLGRLIILYSAYYLLSACMFFLTLGVVDKNAAFHVFWYTAGFYTLAWLIGYLTPGASGGLGVREVALMALMRDIYPQDLILSVALLFRFLGILSEIIAYAFSAWVLFYKSRLRGLL